ncbi:hypothetical protein M5K25_009502 [Dendrobium thyrsiflorum]|uniref:Uncharacterized protein n=1 Tax=Dendrobium thyrsiflorum TaxID=117978 RepID=A0ABD0V5M3_DENTH
MKSFKRRRIDVGKAGETFIWAAYCSRFGPCCSRVGLPVLGLSLPALDLGLAAFGLAFWLLGFKLLPDVTQMNSLQPDSIFGNFAINNRSVHPDLENQGSQYLQDLMHNIYQEPHMPAKESNPMQQNYQFFRDQLRSICDRVYNKKGKLLHISTCTPEGLAIVLCSPRALLSFPSFMYEACMGDPDIDHGFLYDDQGRVDILGSPFFDVEFGNDRTADEYVDRIIYQISLAIEDRIPPGRWYIVSTPPTSPAATTLRATCLLVASLSIFLDIFVMMWLGEYDIMFSWELQISDLLSPQGRDSNLELLDSSWSLPNERYGAGKLVKICGQQSRKVWTARERLLGVGQQAWGCRNPLDSNGTGAEHSGQQAGISQAAIRRAWTARQQLRRDRQRLHRPDPLSVDKIARGTHPSRTLGDYQSPSTTSYTGYFSTNEGLRLRLLSGDLLPRMVLLSTLKPSSERVRRLSRCNSKVKDAICGAFGIACMADSEVDHGFVYDRQGRTDILRSSFFDVYFSYDETANDYIDCILYQLSLSIEHIRSGRWIIFGHPPLPHPPATTPPTKVFSFIFLVVVSILVWFVFLR